MKPRDIDNHHITDLLPAHQNHQTPEAPFGAHDDGTAVAAQETVKDHAPGIAQNDAADQVGHEKHGAEQVGALNPLGQHIGHGEGQDVDQKQGHQGKEHRVPEGIDKAAVLDSLHVVA